MGKGSVEGTAALSEEDSATVTDQLREKINSKMEVAKFFAGFISLLIGILLKDGRMTSAWSRVGILFFLVSLGFCVAALSAYDHLLWPKEYLVKTYWPELKTPPKSEKSFREKLQNQMLCSWKWLSVPALVCLGVGFALLLVQELGPALPPTCLGLRGNGVLLVLLAMAFGAPTAIFFVKWHLLGRRAGSHKTRTTTGSD